MILIPWESQSWLVGVSLLPANCHILTSTESEPYIEWSWWERPPQQAKLLISNENNDNNDDDFIITIIIMPWCSSILLLCQNEFPKKLVVASSLLHAGNTHVRNIF